MPEKGWNTLTVKDETKEEFRDQKPEELSDDAFLKVLMRFY